VTLLLAFISPRRNRSGSSHAGLLAAEYIRRVEQYQPCQSKAFESESELTAELDRQARRSSIYLVLLDSRGKQLTSEGFSATLDSLRNSGVRNVIFAIGPADGWSELIKKRANLVLSLGSITLPHQLALAVLAEQIYRAFTILAGHPYHLGH
jgi:23S rRNA (pseudouridine1915-N3)-methyltransferase